MTNECDDGLVRELRRVIEQLEKDKLQLREIIQPFAAVADGIPNNWPGNCRLRIDRESGVEFLSYHHSQDKRRGTLPTLGQWRMLRLIASIRIATSEQP